MLAEIKRNLNQCIWVTLKLSFKQMGKVTLINGEVGRNIVRHVAINLDKWMVSADIHGLFPFFLIACIIFGRSVVVYIFNRLFPKPWVVFLNFFRAKSTIKRMHYHHEPMINLMI